MDLELKDLINSGIKGLTPYEPGKPIEDLEREYGIKKAIKLASNESPLGPSPKVLEALKEVISGINRYPDGTTFNPNELIVNNATGNFTSVNKTANSTTSSASIIILYTDSSGTNALNTDLIAAVSANGGTNYTTATLVAKQDFATGIKMAVANDVAVTAGTSMKYKISFANQSGSKEARVNGVALLY